jgi:hypothetical protein
MDYTNVTDYTNVKELENIKVHIRCRPPDANFGGAAAPDGMYEAQEKDGKQCILALKKGAKDGGRAQRHEFRFDTVFDAPSTQEEVFEGVGEPLVDHVLKGYNACCFAYGQTGSGKTYTIFGPGGGKLTDREKRLRGLVPRTMEYLFEEIGKIDHLDVKITMNFMELYCDQLRDLGKSVFDRLKDVLGMQRKKSQVELAAMVGSKLLSKLKKKRRPTQGSLLEASKNFKAMSTTDWFEMKTRFGFSDYKITEDDSGRVVVKEAQQIPINSAREVSVILNMGFKMRATEETKMNATSSRSHTICIFTVTQTDPMTGLSKVGVLNMIDLAGSERVKKSEATGQRFKEALSINSSLSALGKVVMMLDPSAGHNQKHIPFRDSKLTRLLQDSLGGNSFTTVLATVHPTAEHYEESLGTLHFAAHCRNVKNQPRVNRGSTLGGGAKEIKELLKEISQLKRRIGAITQNSNMRIAALLGELGVQGHVLADGRVQLAGGQVIGMQAAGAEAGADVSGAGLEGAGLMGSSAGGAGGAIGGAGVALGGAGGRAALESAIRIRMRPLQDKIKSLQGKLSALRREKHSSDAEHRSELSSLREEMDALQDALADAKDQILALTSDKAEVARELVRVPALFPHRDVRTQTIACLWPRISFRKT